MLPIASANYNALSINQIARLGSGGLVADPNFEYVTMLLAGDGANGAQNNTFRDGSTNNFTVTRSGNATQGTFTPFGPNWSNYFDGTGDYLSLATATAFGNSSNTVEFWFYPTDSTVTYRCIYDSRAGGATDTGYGIFQYGLTIEVYGNGLKVATAAAAFSANTWVHVALVRNSGTCQLYINGVASGASATYSSNLTSTVRVIGDAVNLLFPFVGYVSNLREVTSTVYTSNFTPPTTPPTAITNTSLLTCQSNRFIDNSTNAFTITRNGDVSVQRFSPFSPTTAYSSAVIGGSGYFDGNGDYLAAPSNAAFNFSTGDYCLEAWVYLTAHGTGPAGAFSMLFSTNSVNNYWGVLSTGGNVWLSCYDGSTVFQQSSGSQLQLNTWNHVAYVKNGGNFSMYLNGTSVYSATLASSWGATTEFNIGASPTNYSGFYFVNGYVSNARVVKGSPVYTSNFTPSTSPLTAITNTSLLLNFTNAGIIDNAMLNNLETVGNAQISTAQSKFGGSSMLFDGTGDWLTRPSTPNLAFGSGDFTIECWVYANSLGAYNGIFAQWPDSGGSVNNSYVLESVGSNMNFYWVSGATLYGPAVLGTITTGTWIHYAICRSGNTLYPFKNGVLGSTVAITQALNSPTSAITIGGEVVGAGHWDGYIDDLRITKGVARYTANFTPPTAAFQLA